jgi:hypothetical protein
MLEIIQTQEMQTRLMKKNDACEQPRPLMRCAGKMVVEIQLFMGPVGLPLASVLLRLESQQA